MSLKKKFGKRVEQIRKEFGLSREELAGRMGINPVTLYKLEKGINFAGDETIDKLVKALKVDYNVLFTFGNKENDSINNINLKLKTLDISGLNAVNAFIDAYIKNK